MIIFLFGEHQHGKSWFLRQWRDVLFVEGQYNDDVSYDDCCILEPAVLRAAAQGKMVVLVVVPEDQQRPDLRVLGRRWAKIVPVAYLKSLPYYLPEVW